MKIIFQNIKLSKMLKNILHQYESTVMSMNVCCSPCERCRAVLDHPLHPTWANRLQMSDVRVRQATASQLPQIIRQISENGNQLVVQNLRSHSAVVVELRRLTSNANCQNGWIQLPAASRPQRRNWKIVHFSHNCILVLLSRLQYFVQMCSFFSLTEC